MNDANQSMGFLLSASMGFLLSASKGFLLSASKGFLLSASKSGLNTNWLIMDAAHLIAEIVAVVEYGPVISRIK